MVEDVGVIQRRIQWQGFAFAVFKFRVLLTQC